MRIAIMGLGVIGTTYAYAFQKAGHDVRHIVREHKRPCVPAAVQIHLLDGRYNPKGEEKDDTYDVALVNTADTFDFILVSVAKGKLSDAVQTIRDRKLKGTVILFCNFWDGRPEIEKIMGDIPYLVAFPTAGGQFENGQLNCVLFNHIMLESEKKADIPNYDKLISLLESADIKAEIPNDMFEWLWIHMAINAGVTSTAARNGIIDDPHQLAQDLMNDSKALAMAVKTIRETLKVVEARGVDLRLYRSEVLPYAFPAGIAGIVMKKMFASNELTARIMTLHNDVDDMMYGCNCVYCEAKKKNLNLPLFFKNIEAVSMSRE